MSGIAQVTDVANAFSTTLTAGISATDTTITVDSTGDLTAPCYLIIEPLSGTKREVVLCDSNVTATTFVLSGVSKRGLDAPAVSHLAGAKVISGPVAQHIDDLNARVDDVDRQLTVGASEPGTPQTGDLWVDTTAVGGTYTGDFDFTGDVDIQGTLGNVAAVSGDIPSHDGTSFKPKSLAELDLLTETAANGAYRWATGRVVYDVTDATYGALGDGATDDTAAIQAAIDACEAAGGGIVFFPDGDYRVTTITIDTAGVGLLGRGGHLGTTKITGTATSGEVIRFKARSPSIVGIQVGATTARRAATTTTGHGIFFGGNDAASPLIISRQYVRDVNVIDQPTDGIHSRYGCELSKYEQVTVADCKRHGYVFDNGTTSGATNIGTSPFHWTLENVRAIECGGNGVLIGHPSDAGTARGLTATNVQSLGCAWDSSLRVVDYQIAAYAGECAWVGLDVEDQQYAASTTSSGGHGRTSRATPSGGVLLGHAGHRFEHPYFSSLVESINAVGVVGVDVNAPAVFAGTYGVAQPFAIRTSAGSTGFRLRAVTSITSGATRVVQNQNTAADIVIDGVRYLGTALSGSDLKVVPPGAADTLTISGGVLSEPTSTLVVVASETGTSDDLFRLTSAAALDGVVIRFRADAGDTITFNDGNANAGSQWGMDLQAATRVVTGAAELWLQASTATSRWIETNWLPA